MRREVIALTVAYVLTATITLGLFMWLLDRDRCLADARTVEVNALRMEARASSTVFDTLVAHADDPLTAAERRQVIEDYLAARERAEQRYAEAEQAREGCG